MYIELSGIQLIVGLIESPIGYTAPYFTLEVTNRFMKGKPLLYLFIPHPTTSRTLPAYLSPQMDASVAISDSPLVFWRPHSQFLPLVCIR